MRRSTLVACALLTVGSSGCDKVKPVVDPIIAKIQPLIDKIRGRTPPPPQIAQRPDTMPRGGDTAVSPAATPRQGQPPQRSATRTPTPPPPPPPAYQGGTRPLRDEPYFSDDTGTVAPGMSEREIYSIWGEPAAVRRSGEYSYLFFQNGCEYTCGTMDVVTLQDGKVVDAIVRWYGHVYSGQSSSPKGTKPRANVGGDTLRVRPSTP